MTRWMGRFFTVLALTLGVADAALAQAQRGSITGQVVLSESATPARGAQVFVEGTSIGALTNAEGRFTLLNVPAGSRVVRVQLLGYADTEQTVAVQAGVAASVRVELKQQAVAIPSVVVTALGIARKEKSLGYGVTTVGQVAMERTPEVNVINALAGQSPGVQVTSSSGQPGASSRITIRGES